MADKKVKQDADINEDGVNFDAKAMLIENGEKGTIVRFSDRVQVRLLKDTVYQKAGKVYSPHKVKAEALVKQEIAEYVK
jgi:hypothetical protein